MSEPPKTRTREASACALAARRRLLRAAVGLAVASLVPSTTAEAADQAADKMPPQPGDELAFPSWEHDGRLIRGADLELGAAPLLAYPRDPVSGITRERSRLNQILLLRVDEAQLNAATRARAAGGVVAYSAICTHTACGVSAWNAETGHMLCPCHSSEFDPRKGAQIVSGPAPRPLPALPLKQDGDKLLIAGPFTAALGASSP